jgi:hypothetical protein
LRGPSDLRLEQEPGRRFPGILEPFGDRHQLFGGDLPDHFSCLTIDQFDDGSIQIGVDLKLEGLLNDLLVLIDRGEGLLELSARRRRSRFDCDLLPIDLGGRGSKSMRADLVSMKPLKAGDLLEPRGAKASW